jgi:hypothetical protein
MTSIGHWAVAVAIVLAAAVAGAQDRSKGDEGMGSRSPSGPAGTSSQGPTGTGSTAAATTSASDCSHSMRGTVKTVDKATGEVSIVVPGVDDEIAIHLPPSELSGFERGDQVVVSMGLRESRVGNDRPADK